MPNSRFSDDSRDLLEFRPNISFVEPETEGMVSILPLEEDKPQLADVDKRRKELRQFAQAINVLAAATQSRADEKAKNMKIKLDLNIDISAVQAMRRYFPDFDPTEITYDQYREVKECLRSLGRQVAQQVMVDPSEVDAARVDAIKMNTPKGSSASVNGAQVSGISVLAAQMGGFGTPEAANGSLRPERNLNAYVVPPVNIDQLTIDLVCILVNYVWKEFIIPVFKPVRLPPVGPSLADLLPDKLCDPGFDFEIPGLWILGKKPPDLLTGKLTPKVPVNFSEVFNLKGDG